MNLSDARSELTTYLDERMTHRHVPGAVIGIVHGEEELIVVRGVTSVDHPLAVDATTLFQVGSRTKTFTATALMQVERQQDHLVLKRKGIPGSELMEEPPPPIRLGFYDRDCIFDLDEPAGSRGRFLRDAEGRIQHLHHGGRLTPRFQGGESLETLLAAASEPGGNE